MPIAATLHRCSRPGLQFPDNAPSKSSNTEPGSPHSARSGSSNQENSFSISRPLSRSVASRNKATRPRFTPQRPVRTARTRKTVFPFPTAFPFRRIEKQSNAPQVHPTAPGPEARTRKTVFPLTAFPFRRIEKQSNAPQSTPQCPGRSSNQENSFSFPTAFPFRRIEKQSNAPQSTPQRPGRTLEPGKQFFHSRPLSRSAASRNKATRPSPPHSARAGSSNQENSFSIPDRFPVPPHRETKQRAPVHPTAPGPDGSSPRIGKIIFSFPQLCFSATIDKQKAARFTPQQEVHTPALRCVNGFHSLSHP